MKVLLFEDDLIWSTRLTNTLRSLGHSSQVLRSTPESTDAQVAIVNLASARSKPAELVAELKALGLFVIGHAGHKEQEHLQLGSDAGCDLVA
ncbi:MAG TPA: hypothetical protein VEX38_03895, partial [Fimbriimonadaceae bacterium]|nr:hypothetical protein [Fimbriimonadaceae bacterium]